MNDDSLNKNLEGYIESFVLEALEYCKPEDEEKIRSYFYDAIIDSMIDNLDEKQLTEIKENMDNMPVLLSKIELFASEVPEMSDIIENYLSDSLAKIKEDPKVLEKE